MYIGKIVCINENNKIIIIKILTFGFRFLMVSLYISAGHYLSIWHLVKFTEKNCHDDSGALNGFGI